MIVRPYTDSDLKQIKELHAASGLKYVLPDMATCFSKNIVGDEDGIGVVSLMRLTAECYLICNPEWRTPAWRWQAIKDLQVSCNEDAKAKDVQEAVAFIPPQMYTFKGRLRKLGWHRNRLWQSYYKEVV